MAADAFGFEIKAIMLRKKKGQELHRITQQSKRVDTLMAKIIEEVLFGRLVKSMSYPERKKLPGACRSVVQRINTHVHQYTVQARLKLPSGPELLKGLFK